MSPPGRPGSRLCNSGAGFLPNPLPAPAAWLALAPARGGPSAETGDAEEQGFPAAGREAGDASSRQA